MFSFLFTVIFFLITLNNSLQASTFTQTGLGLSCSNRKWSSESDSISVERRQIAIECKTSPLPIFNDSVYLAGVYNRDQSDKMLVDMYANLSTLVLVECVDYKGEFVQIIEDYLNNIVSAKSWASVSDDQDFDYFYGRLYWVDEYSILIANMLTQTLFMLEDVISNYTKNNILNTINTRVTTAMDRHFAGDKIILNKHWWKDTTDNLNVLCWGGVARIAISSITDQVKRDKYVNAALNGAQYSWGAWRQDGFNSEGGEYFSYGIFHAIFMRQHVMEASNGTVDFFLFNPNTVKLLAFGFEYPMSKGNTSQFSDDGVGQINIDVKNYIEMTYISNITNYDVAIDWTTVGLSLRFSLIMVPENRFSISQNLTFETGIRKYYNESAVLICRPIVPSGLAAAFKLLGSSPEIGGDHNHDDAGSYNIMLNGINVVGDIGKGDYEVTWTNRFVESEIWNSYSHPLPIIDGKLQTRNMNYYYYKNVTMPKVLNTTFTNDSDLISFDLTSLYPVPSLVSLVRINFYGRTPGNESVIVQDNVEFRSLTSYAFGIPSKNGMWTEISATPTMLIGMFTVNSTSVNVRVDAINPFAYTAVTKTVNALTYTRLGVTMINPILNDTIKVTYTYV